MLGAGGVFCFVFNEELDMVKMPRKAKVKTEGRTGFLDAGRSLRTRQSALRGPCPPWVGGFARMNE